MSGENVLAPQKSEKEYVSDYERICDFQNLYKAHLRARQGKRNKQEVIQFEMKLAENLTKMSAALENRTYRMKGYYHFTIYEPKKREIYAAHYQDRVVLHCICDEVLNPILWKRLIYDNAACQKGKGTHFALDRFSMFLRKYYQKHGNRGYVLKCDIEKFFEHIDHEILKNELRKVIKDKDVQKLLFHYIDSYETPGKPGKGLPLGNQSSQSFAIFYMDRLDRFIKEKLGMKYYVRYMDDWLILHHDRECLKANLEKLNEFVCKELHLIMNQKTQIFALTEGVEFLGWRFFLTENGRVIRRMRSQSRCRMKRKLRKTYAAYEAGEINKERVRACEMSYWGHLKHGDTYFLRRSEFGRKGA